MVSTTWKLAADIATKLGELDDARTAALGAALRCKAAQRHQHPSKAQTETETRALRSALDRIAGALDEADTLLDKLEEAAGLIDQDGRRLDDPAPARIVYGIVKAVHDDGTIAVRWADHTTSSCEAARLRPANPWMTEEEQASDHAPIEVGDRVALEVR